ncbi:hypothetical protein B0A50_06267 [Salinomyces thailandicus]|uniref:Uncharacterized protein n=1 Tax=Salinomyces thailandicus TaxID=706561 RepID=A0A4U0TT74_9PEZI|nr:hypothetical protein B0A50_06267 [Salinomyces thailandica]
MDPVASTIAITVLAVNLVTYLFRRLDEAGVYGIASRRLILAAKALGKHRVDLLPRRYPAGSYRLA